MGGRDVNRVVEVSFAQRPVTPSTADRSGILRHLRRFTDHLTASGFTKFNVYLKGRSVQGCIKPLICVKPSKALHDFSGHCLRFDILSADAETASIAKQSRTGRPGATPDQPRFLPTATALE